MTLREWLQLLIVPLLLGVLAVGLTAWFNNQQAARQQQFENQRAQHAQKIENQRAEAERELGEQRAQDEALQAYLDQMSGLLLEKDLRNSEENSEVRTLARARTLTVLVRLGNNNEARNTDLRRNVVQFLYEAELIRGQKPVIDLDEADLQQLDLSGMLLQDVNLNDTDLAGATFGSGDNLSGAWMGGANLTDATLSGVNLRGAYFEFANLGGADLSNADLSNADLTEVYKVNNDGTKQLVTNEELEAQADSLEGATMPNGHKYED